MPSLPHSSFTTDSLAEEHRFDAWREDVSTIFDVEKSPISDEVPYHASFDLYNFGDSVFAELTASSGRYLRTRRKATRDGMDAILIQLFLEGGVQFGAGRRTTYARAGDIVVFDLAQPVNNINTEFRHLTVMWPRAAIEEMVPGIARWHGRTLPRNSATVALLRQHMASCYEMAPRLNVCEGKQVEKATLSLVGAALAGAKLANEIEDQPDVARVITCQIKCYIRENLGSPALSPELIAAHFGISRTRLYELLEHVGGIANYQKHLRLQRCLADLQNPAKAHLQISEIAYRWGFSQIATFNRNFRKAFDVTPTEARALGDRHAIARAAPQPCHTLETGRDHHQWFQAIGV